MNLKQVTTVYEYLKTIMEHRDLPLYIFCGQGEAQIGKIIDLSEREVSLALNTLSTLFEDLDLLITFYVSSEQITSELCSFDIKHACEMSYFTEDGINARPMESINLTLRWKIQKKR